MPASGYHCRSETETPHPIGAAKSSEPLPPLPNEPNRGTDKSTASPYNSDNAARTPSATSGRIPSQHRPKRATGQITHAADSFPVIRQAHHCQLHCHDHDRIGLGAARRLNNRVLTAALHPNGGEHAAIRTTLPAPISNPPASNLRHTNTPIGRPQCALPNLPPPLQTTTVRSKPP